MSQIWQSELWIGHYLVTTEPVNVFGIQSICNLKFEIWLSYLYYNTIIHVFCVRINLSSTLVESA